MNVVAVFVDNASINNAVHSAINAVAKVSVCVSTAYCDVVLCQNS